MGQINNVNTVKNSVKPPIVTSLTNKRKVKTPKKVQDLGKNEFLKLLVTQLSHQDPLRPMEDKEFIAQMAQFSTLEQMMEIKNNISKMNKLSKLNRAFFFLGKTVKVLDKNLKKVIVGKVQEIDMTTSDDPKLKINNRIYKMSDVIGLVLSEGNNLNTDKKNVKNK